MRIVIHERRTSFASTYDITGDFGDFFARKAPFSLFDNIVVTSATTDDIAKIAGKFSWMRSLHRISISNGQEWEFKCVQRFKGVYVCASGPDRFDIYLHKGRRTSIFLNNRQVGCIVKSALSMEKGNEYEIVLDSNANPLLAISIALCLSDGDDDNAQTVNYDFGNIGPEARKFDESWGPR